jgi:formylglycine-generating enzyme required for sulfatase activity
VVAFALASACGSEVTTHSPAPGPGSTATTTAAAAGTGGAGGTALAPPAPPRSCASKALGAGDNCGLDGTDDCCDTRPVAGGTFYRDNDGVDFTDKSHPATVSPFYLDTYEITVGRFRAFIDGYPGSKPKPGDGAHPKIPGSGWQDAWPMPADAAAFRAELSAKDPNTGCGAAATFTAVAGEGSNERLPINCATWYELFAFCAWDGGRLPTLAEWEFAAAGGNQQRHYPWSSPPTSTVVDPSFAVYSEEPVLAPLPGPENVGSKPKGRGRWGQLDLIGNIGEELLDHVDQKQWLPMPCDDCALLGADTSREKRGGWWGGAVMRVVDADTTDAAAADDATGARCARDPR